MKAPKKAKKTALRRGWRTTLVWQLTIPLLVYFAFFCLYTWPWITHFNGWYFTDTGDGFQNVWNVWWVNKSVTQLHQLPWHTMYLHAPYGVSLLGQTLNPFNGFVAIGLLKFLSLNQAFNVMVIFSFLFGGLSMFWLCYEFTKRWLPSLLGGFIFTFSSYHFAHALGHMQLVSLEFIPLFILLWWRFLKKPTYWLGAGAAVTLLLVLLCDYYYFLYSVATAVAILVHLWRKKELTDVKDRRNWGPFATFIVLGLLLVAPLPLALLRINHNDPLLGSHPSRLFSTDIFTPFVDGGFWKFHSLTNFYWKDIKAFLSESSIYTGISVLVLLVYALVKSLKKKVVHPDVNFWLILIIVFGIFSLGPRLLVNGYSINHAPLPYIVLERVVPGLKLSGVPVRMMFMVSFGAAIISAMVLSRLKLRTPKGKLLMALFAVVLVLEMWPGRLPLTPNTQPTYVKALRDLAPTGVVLDNAAIGQSYQLYHQTLFDRPMVLGYISRVPTSVDKKDQDVINHINPAHYSELCSLYHLRYITTPAFRPLQTNFPVVFRDNEALIYDLKNSPNC